MSWSRGQGPSNKRIILFFQGLFEFLNECLLTQMDLYWVKLLSVRKGNELYGLAIISIYR